MDTHTPSGMLCRAMAKARAPPREGEERVATKVARPSGKLWRAMASPVSSPILFRFFLSAVTISVTSLNSSGPSGWKSYTVRYCLQCHKKSTTSGAYTHTHIYVHVQHVHKYMTKCSSSAIWEIIASALN